MKILGIESRDVFVALEFSLAELENIVSFLKIVIPMFNQVYTNSENNLAEEMDRICLGLETLIKEIDNNGS